MYVINATSSVSVCLMVHIVCNIPLGPVCLAFHLCPLRHGAFRTRYVLCATTIVVDNLCDIFITLVPLGPVGVSLSLCPVESMRLGVCINGGKFLVQLPPLTILLIVYAALSSP